MNLNSKFYTFHCILWKYSTFIGLSRIPYLVVFRQFYHHWNISWSHKVRFITSRCRSVSVRLPFQNNWLSCAFAKHFFQNLRSDFLKESLFFSRKHSQFVQTFWLWLQNCTGQNLNKNHCKHSFHTKQARICLFHQPWVRVQGDVFMSFTICSRWIQGTKNVSSIEHASPELGVNPLEYQITNL